MVVPGALRADVAPPSCSMSSSADKGVYFLGLVISQPRGKLLSFTTSCSTSSEQTLQVCDLEAPARGYGRSEIKKSRMVAQSSCNACC